MQSPGVPGAEGNVRRLLELPVTRGQYEEGARSPELIAPDGWTLDQHFLDQPGRKDAREPDGSRKDGVRRHLDVAQVPWRGVGRLGKGPRDAGPLPQADAR